MKFLLAIIFAIGSFYTSYAQQKHEVRAAWITNLYGLDWPRTRATSQVTKKQQQEELIHLLDLLKAANMNTVIFQTRARGDLFYPSNIEPYNAILTGVSGKDPGYDPLQFAIKEAHKRGMECHAWIVAIPLGNRRHVRTLGKRSVTRRKKNITLYHNRQYYLNPGHPDTKKYLMSIVKEVITRYDIDGVHFDYLRYPKNRLRFPDYREYKKYSQGKSREQWRRDNITDIIRYLYQHTKEIKPWVKVSVCPIGKYSSTTRYSSYGWDALNAVNQDAKGWLAEGIVDQLYPMMYYKNQHFYPFALDWKEASNGRQIIPGLGIYFLDPAEGNWKSDEIERQIYFIRKHQLNGEGFYRVKYLAENVQDIYNIVKDKFYTYPALQPPMTWLDSVQPQLPKEWHLEHLENCSKLSWKRATDNDTINSLRYTIYGDSETPVDISNPENIIATNCVDTNYVYYPILPWNRKIYFAVTAVDRYGNESKPLQLYSTNTKALYRVFDVTGVKGK